MKKLILSTISLAMIVGGVSCSSDNKPLESPDGRICVKVETTQDGRLFYTASRDGAVVVDTSYLGLTFASDTVGLKSRIAKVTPVKADETWTTVWGEEKEIRNNYRGAIYEIKDGTLTYNLEMRVFDDGFGFRYEFPEQSGKEGDVVILDENTQFNIPAEATAWSIPWNTNFYEGLYLPKKVSELDTVATPVTLKVKDDLYMTIHEANLTDYASLNLRHADDSEVFQAYLTPWSTGEKVFAKFPFVTPWRFVIIGERPADLMLSRIMLNLNDPCAIEDTSWIEPGRYVGIWWGMHLKDYTWELEESDKHGATTERTKKYIDFAADHGYSGVLVEGWNVGWFGDWAANGHKLDFVTPYPDYDLQALADYAKEKGVRIIAHNETGGAAANYETRLDSAFTLYNSLGMNAVKTGYVGVLLDGKEYHGSQYGVRHYRKVIEEAAKHHLMIDNHEPAIPTGLQRTWPNLMTQEGVRGGEWDAWSKDGGNPPSHTVTLPFTRGLAGPMDYTPGIFKYDNPANPGTHPQSTIAKQLAMVLILYSPLQMSADKIENYEGRPELEFITRCPTTWDVTLVPEAAIGEYITMARKARDGEDWYVAAMTGDDAHTSSLALDFLTPGKTYKAKIFADGEGADGRTNPYPVSITEQDVNSETVLNLNLAPSGGVAIILEPKAE